MILVKVYSRRTANPEIHRVETLPATLGRAVENTISIGDKSVSAKHAIIERAENGALRLRDLASTNGLNEDGKKTMLVELNKTKSIRVGNVWIEISTSEDELEPTVRVDLDSLDIEEGWSHKKGALVCAAFIVLSLLLRFVDYHFTRVTYTAHGLLSQSLSFVVAAFGFAAAASVFSKVHLRRYQFYPLFAIVLGFSVVGEFQSKYFDIVTFNLNRPFLAKLLDNGISITVVFIGCYLIGRLLFPETRPLKRAGFIASGLTCILAVSYGLRSLSKDDGSPNIDTVISLPLHSFANADQGLTRVLKEIDELETKILKSREEILEKENERTQQETVGEAAAR